MNVQVEEAGPCRKKLLIELDADSVSAEYKTVLDSYKSLANIPGFRKGKAPQNLVVSRYGKDIEQDVKDRLIPQGYREALEKESITPVSILGVEKVNYEVGKPLSFTVLLDVPPSFDLPEYKGLKLKRNAVEVKDEEVEETVQRILEGHARYEEVTGRPVEKGDLIQVDFTAHCGGTPLEVLAPEAQGLGKGTDFWVHAGENAFLPEFETGLVGAGIGESKVVEVTFPEDFKEAVLAGKKAEFNVDIKGIRCKEMPELDEKLLEQLGVESEEDLRQSIRKDLERLANDRESGRLKNEIMKELMDKTSMELPSSVVEEETRSTIYDMVRQNSMQGINREQIEENRDQIFEAAGKTAEEKVKARYLLHKIAETEGIDVSNEEFSQRIRAMSFQYSMPEDALRQQLAKSDQLENVRDQVRVDKTLDFLLEQAEIGS